MEAFLQPQHVQLYSRQDFLIPQFIGRRLNNLMQKLKGIRNPHQNVVKILHHFHQLVHAEGDQQIADSLFVCGINRASFPEEHFHSVRKAFVQHPLFLRVLQNTGIHSRADIIVILLQQLSTEGMDGADAGGFDFAQSLSRRLHALL